MLDKSIWPTLTFEMRQKIWNGEFRQFRQHHGRGNRPNVWEISVEGNRVFTRYGLLDGAMQETNYQGKYKNKGKKNEILPIQDAIAEARRDCRKKWDFEGYDEYVDGINIDKRNEQISIPHLLTALPGSFCLYKPENNLYDQKGLLAKAKEGNVLYTIKKDGIAKLIVVDYYGNIKIYSRRAREWSDTEGPKELEDGTLDYSTVRPWALRFPQLVDDVRALNLPNGSMIAVELVHIDKTTGKEKFAIASGLTKGYTDRALEDQARLGMATMYWWDIPFYDGQDLIRSTPTFSRYKLILDLFEKSRVSLQHTSPILVKTFKSPEEAEEEAKNLGIEGWVVVDPHSVYGDRGWNIKGKPDRPSTCAKLKVTSEDDFIVMWDPDNKIGEWGTGDNERGKIVKLSDGRIVEHGGVGSIMLYQYNAKGELVPISKCSSGMTYEFQAQLRKEHFPFIAKCEYKGRSYISEGEKTNSLRHPVFVMTRTDKTFEECMNELL
jgi:hypothetical protein